MSSDSDESNPPRRKVRSDERGRSVWVDTIETASFELVSTQTLKTLLDQQHAREREEIERVAAGGDEGYLARDSATGHFQIIDDTALQAILDQRSGATPAARAADVTAEPPSETEDLNELQLVSTQALRQILGEPEPKKPRRQEPSARDKGGGFDPYNAG